ncbi:astacin [Ancylostoma duodenale]|uniref:Metalloendopeptidase n=1 Tax=Ancylostoma duodenale TaxID=51022 RepID=A0A0C2G2X0_9BILA|nr:astacin [Ancylostoma duodenale]
MKKVAIISFLLFAACISGRLLGDFLEDEENELVTRFDRYRRQAQIRGPGAVFSKVINYHFKDGTTRDRMLVTDEGTQCLYQRNRTGRGLKIMYVGCGYYGGAAHEVGHALWLDHTHNRHDRDRYLDVNDKSIKLYREQYRKMTTFENYNYKLPYDYGSIMHYGSSGPNPTMTPKDRRYHRTMGSPLISFTDLAMVNKHYRCEGVKTKELYLHRRSQRCSAQK